MKTARKHERFIEDLGDDIRVTPGFGLYLRPFYCFLAHIQSPVSGLASLVSEHELDNTPRSPEAVWRGHCSVRGREFQSPFFPEVFMVPRPLAPVRAMRSRTCADVIQPCRLVGIGCLHPILLEASPSKLHYFAKTLLRARKQYRQLHKLAQWNQSAFLRVKYLCPSDDRSKWTDVYWFFIKLWTPSKVLFYARKWIEMILQT